MWREYSWSYVKNNLASSVSVMVAAFISALLLSLLCGLFYNLWKYDVERIRMEEGSWQGRIAGELSGEDLKAIKDYATVEYAAINEALSNEKEIVVDIYFENMRTVLEDMPRLAALVGMGPEAITYHHALLSMYFIRDPQDPAPRLILPFFFAVTAIAGVSLILIIHNSFAASMNARIHQFGIFSSIGATPGQIRACLLQEAAALCALPVAAGNLLGIAVSAGIINGTNIIASDVTARVDASWGYHPLILTITLIITVVTIWISAWLPARKMSRLTPLESIKNPGEFQLKRRKHSRILAFLFGVEGELAGNALKAQRKALRTAALSLTLSFLAFSLMQCFFTLTGISQRMTYFEKYQDIWDVMVTVKDTEIAAFHETGDIRELSGVRNAAVYQKAMAKRTIAEEELSDEIKAAGGLSNAPGAYVSDLAGSWLVNAPVVILDDISFLQYCGQIGAAPRLDGAVVLNRIKDYSDPDFRSRRYFPYIKESQGAAFLRKAGETDIGVEIPVISYAQEAPALKEAYDDPDCCVLVHVLPLSLWEHIKGQIGGAEPDTYIRVLGRDNVTLGELNELQQDIAELAGRKYTLEIENRLQENISNDNMMRGMMLVLGGFCVLLAIIGIGNVFSNTFGFVRQRKREIARYMSIGLTPGGIKKIFCLEAAVIAGRPVLIALPLTAAATGVMIKISYLDPMIFIREMPALPILAFIFAIFGSVALAYFLGGKRVLQNSLADTLRDDTII